MSVDTFALVPQNTMVTHFYVWNLLTSGFFEPRLFLALFTCGGILLFGDKLESVWGPKQYVIFVVGIHLAIAVATFFTAYVCYVLDMQWMMSQYYSGFLGVLAALTVALKQSMPDVELTVAFISLRPKYLPFLLTSTGLCVDFIVRNGPHAMSIATKDGSAPPGSQTPFLVYGSLFGWAYLRFLQAKETTTADGAPIHGDLSESFAFHTLFPEPFQPLIAALCAFIYAMVRALGCCGVWHKQYEEHLVATRVVVDEDDHIFGDMSQGRSIASSTADAERRRKLALQALEARLKNVHKSPLGDDESFDVEGDALSPADGGLGVAVRSMGSSPEPEKDHDA